MVKSLLKERIGLSRVWFLLAFIMMSVGAKAQDYVPLELNKEYTVSFAQAYYYSYTATESGMMRIASTSADCPEPYSTQDFTPESRVENTFTYDGNGGSKREFSVVAGTTYYIGDRYPMNGFTFVASMVEDEGITLTSADPAQGTAYDITSSSGLLTLVFNVAVDADASATVTSGTQSAQVEVYRNAVGLTVELKNTIYGWLESGAVKPGDKFTITFTGIHAVADSSIVYGTDGTMTLEYLVPEMPLMKVSESIPSVFKSYWIPGDETAVASVTFDGALLSVADGQKGVATLQIGNAEMGDAYAEELPVQIDGNTAYVDFSGKLRTYETMGLVNTYWSSFTLKFVNIQGADGQVVYSAGQGTVGSFTYTVPFSIVTSDVYFEFTPATKSSIANATTAEIYISDATAVSFDGVDFTYTGADGNEVVTTIAKADCTIAEEGEGLTVTVTIPEALKSQSDVTVGLHNPQFADGLTRSEKEITAIYNYVPKLVSDFAAISVSPANETIVAALDSVVLTFDDKVYLGTLDESSVQFVNFSNRGDLVNTTVTVDPTDSKNVIIKPVSTLLDGNQYHLAIKAGIFGDEEFNTTGGETGRTNPAVTYHYNVNEALANAPYRTTPYDGETVLFLDAITLEGNSVEGPTYSGNRVYVTDAAGNEVAEATVETGDLAHTLLITLDKVISTPGAYTLVIEDSVFYNGQGYEAEPNAAVSFTFNVANSYNLVADLEIESSDPESESTLTELGDVLLQFGDHANLFVNPDIEISVYNRIDRVVATTGKLSKMAGGILLALNDTITDAGTYSIEIPQGAVGDATWMQNNYLDGHTNAAFTLLYVIEEGAIDYNVTITPAEGEVTSLKSFQLIFNDEEYAGVSGLINATVTDADGNVVGTTDTGELDQNLWNAVVFTLSEEITAPGTYTLTIPAGAINFGEIGSVECGELKFTYTIGGGGSSSELPESSHPASVTTDPADRSTVSSLKDITITFDGAEYAAPSWNAYPELLDADGNVVMENINNLEEIFDPNDFFATFNYCYIHLNTEVTANGIYVLNIPAGTFIVDGNNSEAMTFVYVVGEATGISKVLGDASKYDVYTFGGAKVKSTTNKAELNSLKSGAYIINGKKVIINKK